MQAKQPGPGRRYQLGLVQLDGSQCLASEDRQAGSLVGANAAGNGIEASARLPWGLQGYSESALPLCKWNRKARMAAHLFITWFTE